MSKTLPLFLLNTVLFPGGVLSLRVFEARYMDMVRDCLRDKTAFGVCLKQSADVPETTGCSAEITGWDMKDLGILNLTTRGVQRFNIDQQQMQPDGLIRAEVTWLANDPVMPLEDQHKGCALLLANIIAELEQKFSDADKADKVFPVATPYQMGDAAWVANRLCEVLPIPLRAKQRLMALDGGAERLEIVHTYLKQHKIL